MRALFIALFSLGVALCEAQDVVINGNSSQPSVLQSTNTSTANMDRPAVYGISKPTPAYGIGVQGEGSYKGVLAIGTGATSTYNRYGVYAVASGATVNYGIWASAPTSSGSYAGYFNGNLRYTGSLTGPSDKKLKKNILPMGPTLEKVAKLQPKTFVMRTDEFPGLGLPSGPQMGLIAQDVDTVFPDLVSTSTVPTSSERNSPPITYEGVNYIGLIPVLIKAIQEQQTQITALQAQIAAIRGQLK